MSSLCFVERIQDTCFTGRCPIKRFGALSTFTVCHSLNQERRGANLDRAILFEAPSRLGSERTTSVAQSFLRLLMPGLVLAYCAAFQWSYVKWIAPVWGYTGATYNSPDPALLSFAYLLAFALAVVSPQRIRRPSQLIYWILFFTVYIPGMLAPLFMQLDSNSKLFLLELSLAGGMIPIALSSRLKMANIRSHPVSSRLFWSAFFIAFLLMNASLLIAFRGNMHIASLKEVYDVRAQGSLVAQENPGISYISTLLANVMNPFLMAYGLSVKRRKLAALGALGQVLVYSTAAMKSVLLSPIFIVLIFYTIKRHRVAWVPKLALFCCAMFVGLTMLTVGHREGLFFTLASITLYRTFAIPGFEIGEYQYFFENFPHTFFSQVHGLNLLIAYPYKLSLGQEVGSFFIGAASNGRIVNENVSFFAMDGIASLGLPGILVMGVICAFTFWVLDSSARKYPVTFTASALTSCAMSLTNASLFTSLLSGGLLLFMALFVVLPRDTFAHESAH